jgi:RNA recognition motif-containing protein
MNIYVGNLSYDAGEEDIKKAFEQFGEVVSVKIIMDRYSGRSKGFGFVEMPNDDEANSAIKSLNGKEHMGRELRVNEARPRPEGGERGGGGGGGGGRRERF